MHSQLRTEPMLIDSCILTPVLESHADTVNAFHSILLCTPVPTMDHDSRICFRTPAFNRSVTRIET